ncbi:MAG: ABC transporter ATP-binding protein [Candidatus Omnitrophota bacterium]|jgi:ABC-type polysaccharide/polyol phosphate transport system ATPase subunit
MVSIKLQSTWLKYRIEFKENGRFMPEDFWSLKNINLEVKQGEVVGIIGENGAGKSTLLRVIGGMLKPDKGSFEVNGKVAGLIDLGGGFQKDLTGKENVYLISSLFGLSRKQAEARYNDIVKFAAIGRFINAPVKCYSQGMLMRLGFAIAIYVDPDILLLDDSFVVGDIYAQNKCINKLFELRDQGKTIILVSHDLSIAKRMCSRGIFLREGRIIKDDLINRVCDYYTETVGDKKGIAILEEGQSGIVFNNGRLIIRCKEGAITARNGGFSTVTLSGREYLSTSADWQVDRIDGTDGKGIIATGSWPDMPVLERWRLLFLNERELIWEITIESIIEGLLPERCQTSVIFQEGYKDWFTTKEEKAFSKAFLQGGDWQCEMVDDSLNAIIGLKGEDASSIALPVVILDRISNNQQARCRIGNTGSIDAGRILDYAVFPEEPDPGGSAFKWTVFYSKLIFFDPSRTETILEFLGNARKLMRDSIFISSGALGVSCREREIGIYWNEILVTRDAGLNTQFIYQDKSYSAIEGNWSITRESSRQIRVVISWDALRGLRQIWRIIIDNDENNTVKWEITLETDEEHRIINRQTELLLNKEYSGWFTAEENGQFDRMEKKGGAVVLNKYANNYAGVEALGKKEALLLPEASLSCDSDIPMVSYISKNNGESSPGVKLQFLEIDSIERVRAYPGKNKYFNGSIRIATPFIRPDGKSERKQISVFTGDIPCLIRHGRLSFIFDHGKGRILWDDLELTKGLSLYSSGLIQERWHDSSQARWQVSKADATSMVVVGQWPWVPMKQIWEISVAEARTIMIKISKQIWDDKAIIFEREQVGLMVSDYYKEWFFPRQFKAKFPVDFIGHTGIFWERLWCGAGSSIIGVEKSLMKKGLFKRKLIPSLSFESFPDSQARQAIVENTDDLFQARVMQYEISPRSGSGGGTSIYFHGKIKVIT